MALTGTLIDIRIYLLPLRREKVNGIRRLAGKLLILQQNLPCSFCQAAETAALPGPQYDKFLSFETASGDPPHMVSRFGLAAQATAMTRLRLRLKTREM